MTPSFRRVLALVILLSAAVTALGGAPPVAVLSFDGVVDAPHADYILRGLRSAQRQGAQLAVIELNTPGGSLEATKQIVQAILASPVPVAVYITPSGGGAASAGVFITLAANIAAMAPGTNIGSAHPVDASGDDIKGDMRSKVENFSAAWIRTIAEQRGRNAQWAEDAVRRSVAATENEAIKLKIVDLVSPSMTDLLARIDGREVTAAGRKLTLHTQGAPVTPIPPSTTERLLMFLVNPYLIVILGSVALFGILGEVQNPGAIVPGVAGAIALLLVLYGGSMLPVNSIGVAFILLSVVLFVIDLYAPSHGALTAGGVVSLFLGLTMLFRGDFGSPRLSLAFVIPVTLCVGAMFALVLSAGVRAQLRPKVTGAEGMLGRMAEARKALNPAGQVFMDGTYWRAISAAGPIPAGTAVRVVRVDGITLVVEPAATPVATPTVQA